MIDIKCVYDKFYNDIEAENVKITGENIETNDSGAGKFSFTLTQYMDSELTQAAKATDQTELGSDLYFQLSMAYPIPDLVYSLVGEYSFLCVRLYWFF